MAKETKLPTLHEIFGPAGVLARAHANYEFRPEQLEMARAVQNVFREGGHLCVEAGTGTGKTLAYLIPALASGNRVVVSTGTRALQEQLIHKDIPFLAQALNRKISACVVKGRGNYLCLERLEAARHSPQYSGLFPQESLIRIGQWARETQNGDRAELKDLPDDFPEWRYLDARREICLGQACNFYKDCFVTRVRQKAAESNIIIVNHHLFFADLAIKDGEAGGVLPDYQVVVFDEAHEIEDVATQFFGVSANNYRFEDWKRDLDRAVDSHLDEHLRIQEEADSLLQAAERFFRSWHRHREEGRQRLYAEGGLTPADLAVREETTALRLRVDATLSHLARMERTKPLDDLYRRLREINADLRFVLAGDNKGCVYWQEVRGRGVFLQASPINVSGLLREKLFSRVRTAVLTSATLATDGHFQFIRSRLGLEAAQEKVLGSHFRYDQQAILYIPARICDPRRQEFSEAMADEVQELLSITEGRGFVLFTSYQQMNRVYELLSKRLPFPLLLQGQNAAPHLLAEFRSTPHCVLFGTTSFWQGVDVQGEALSCVILEKIPFSVPTEPLVEARLEQIRNQGGDAFNGYQVPEAIILLKQGLGRLIRSSSDRGVLAIMDKRILTHAYGKKFRDNMPPCRMTQDLDVVRKFFRAGTT